MIEIETLVRAPLPLVWSCWTSPEHITRWNTASEDWHTTKASVDLRPEGRFTARMEARDGSMGFDFAGRYLSVDPERSITSEMDDGRRIRVEFLPVPEGVLIRESFEAETTNPEEMQRAGWQAILDNFARHVEAEAKRV